MFSGIRPGEQNPQADSDCQMNKTIVIRVLAKILFYFFHHIHSPPIKSPTSLPAEAASFAEVATKAESAKAGDFRLPTSDP